MGWLGDGCHRGQGRQAWTAVQLPPRYPQKYEKKRNILCMWTLGGVTWTYWLTPLPPHTHLKGHFLKHSAVLHSIYLYATTFRMYWQKSCSSSSPTFRDTHWASIPQQQTRKRYMHHFNTVWQYSLWMPNICGHEIFATYCHYLTAFCQHLIDKTLQYTVWVKKKSPPPRLSEFFSFFHKRLRIFNRFSTHLLYVPMYAGLQIFIQLSPTLTKLWHIKCDYLVHIICAKCPKRARSDVCVSRW